MSQETTSEPDAEIDPITAVYEGTGPSLTGRSNLTFMIGRHQDDGSLHLRIAANDGGGMFCKDWASAGAIEAIVLKATELTSKSFQVLHPGRSINTAGFVLAALKELGLVRPNEQNTRFHEHVPGTCIADLLASRMGDKPPPSAKPGRRKAKEA
jgi:hypothetical protein